MPSTTPLKRLRTQPFATGFGPLVLIVQPTSSQRSSIRRDRDHQTITARTRSHTYVLAYAVKDKPTPGSVSNWMRQRGI